MKRILSFGAGVNSGAMLAIIRLKKIPIDEVVFADTGAEEPATYEWLRRFAVPYFEKEGMKFTVVRSKYGDIYDFYFNKRLIPFKSRRECTDKFKIRPINEYIEKQCPDGKVVVYIGYDADEPQRAVKRVGKFIHAYPLIEHDIGREQCKKIVHGLDLQVPERSRCYFCPFKSKEAYREMALHQPDMFAKVRALEENCQRRVLLLGDTSMAEIYAQVFAQQKLSLYGVHKMRALEYKGGE